MLYSKINDNKVYSEQDFVKELLNYEYVKVTFDGKTLGDEKKYDCNEEELNGLLSELRKLKVGNLKQEYKNVFIGKNKKYLITIMGFIFKPNK